MTSRAVTEPRQPGRVVVERRDDEVAERLAVRRPRSPRGGVCGAAWTMTLMTCVPGAAPSTSEGSASDGIVASMIGALGRPAVLGVVVGALHGVDAGRDDDPAAEQPRVVARGREAGQPGQHEVDLGDRAGRPDVARPPEQARSDRDRVGEARSARASGSMPATTARALSSSPPARTTPVARPSREVMRGDLGAGPDLDAGLASRPPRARSASAPGPPRAKTVWPGGAAVVAGRVGQQHGRRPGRPRPHRRVLDAAPGDRGLERVRLERLGHEVRDRHRQDPGDRPAVVPAEAAERPAEPEAGEGVAEPGRFDVGRRLGREVAEEARPASGRGGRTRRSARRRPRTGPAGPRRSAPRRPTARSRRRPGRARRRRTSGPTSDSPWRSQVEVADDRRPQPADRVGQGRHPRPGRELGRAGGAADASRAARGRPSAGRPCRGTPRRRGRCGRHR